MSNPKRTYVTLDESISHQERKGFAPVCRYGTITPEKDEIGGIFKQSGETTLDPSGLWVTEAICIERIFIRP